MKKIPKRTCISCKYKCERNELLKIVINKKNEISIDETFRAEGRGAYICKKIECLENLIKTKKLERTFNIKIENEIYDKIRGVLFDK